MFPDEFPLSGQALQNWLRTDGQRIFTDSESGAQGLELLRSLGASIRDSVFYQIRREVLSLGLYTEALQNRPDEQLIPLAWTTDKHGLDISSDFLYRVKASGIDPNTGETIERFFSVASGNQLTPGQVKDIIGSMVIGEEGFYGILVDSFELFEALRRPA